MNILEEIAEKTRNRVKDAKRTYSLEQIRQQALSMDANTDYPFYQALKKKEMSVICEVKKASPSKGIIAKDFPYVEIAKSYERGGADAISVLTEPFYFKGNNMYLTEIRKNVNLPLLRKDFVVDEYMIYEAKIIGADAILLICALLSEEILKKYIEIATQLGLSALVEAHDEMEVKKAIQAGAKIIGVNNRDLKTFTVDINNSIRLRKMVPKDLVFVSESGIKTEKDISLLVKNNVNAVLMGETMMVAKDREQKLNEIKTQVCLEMK